MEPAALVPSAPAAAAAVTERFQPGGVLQALVSGLIELALAAVFLAGSLLVSDSSDSLANSLAAAAALWAVMAVYGLALSLLRARVFAAELDDQAVVLHGVGGARRLPYDHLSAVEVTRNRTRLVARSGRGYTVRGVRGRAQGNRFRARVLARATEAVQRRQTAQEGGTGSAAAGSPEDPPRDPPVERGDADRLPHAEG
jgi:hypothetical protein